MEVEDVSPMIEEIASTTTAMNEDTAMNTGDETSNTNEGNKVLEPWEEKLLDAQEILALAAASNGTATTSSVSIRPTTRMHLEALGKRLQKEGEALRRISTTTKSSTPTMSTAITTTPSYISQQPVTVTLPSSVKFIPIDRFAFDAGGYNEPFVTLYIDMDNVGTVRDSVSCQFTKSSFDLIINNLNDKSYRLYKDNLEKDIDPDKSKFSVKANKVIIKLHKIKTSEYGGFDYWTKLTDPKKANKLDTNGGNTTKKDDPSASIMDMMKQMYDEGDDNMKKIIGETMMKQRNGELGHDKDKFGKLGGGSGMDDMDDF